MRWGIKKPWTHLWPRLVVSNLAALPPSRQLEAGADLPSLVPLLGVTRGKAFGALMVRFIAFGRSSCGGLLAGRRDEAAIASWPPRESTTRQPPVSRIAVESTPPRSVERLNLPVESDT